MAALQHVVDKAGYFAAEFVFFMSLSVLILC